MKRNWMLGIGCVVVALVLTLGTTLLDSPVLSKNAAAKLSGETAFQLKQNVIGTSETPHEIQMIYEKDQLLGILTDEKKLEKLLADVYQKDYQKEFPDSRLALGEEIHTEYEMTNLIYEDKDEELLNYLKKNDLFSIEVNQINFSNGEVAYAKDLKDFDQAMEQYVASYLDKESYELLKKGLETPALTTYGERFIDYEVMEKIEYTKGLASISDILLNKKDATAYFAYGMEHTD